MSNRREPTKQEWLEIARGIANGRDVIEIAGWIGIDRSTLSGWMRRDGFLYEVAAALSSPDDLGADGLAYLRDEELHERERKSAWALRMEFWEIVQDTFPAYFEKERRAREREERARQRRADAAARKAEREEREAEKREARAAECLAADFYNLQTLNMVLGREWINGTADELARGLDTPEKRRAYRCRHGIRWTCSGFGVYYAPTWSAIRCEMEYCENDAGFYSINDNPKYAQTWAEIEAEQSADVELEYRRDPFKRRDPRLPMKPAEAEALWRKVNGGTDFTEVVG